MKDRTNIKGLCDQSICCVSSWDEWWFPFASRLVSSLCVSVTWRVRQQWPKPFPLSTPVLGSICHVFIITANNKDETIPARKFPEIYFRPWRQLCIESFTMVTATSTFQLGKHSRTEGVLRHSQHSAAFECRTRYRHLTTGGQFPSPPVTFRKSMSGWVGEVSGHEWQLCRRAHIGEICSKLGLRPFSALGESPHFKRRTNKIS